MARTLPCLILLIGLAHAQQESYEAVMGRALRAETDRAPGEQPDEPLDRAYEIFADAVRVAPTRWEAFMYRGINRLSKAVLARRILEDHLNRMRASGETPETVAYVEAQGEAYIEETMRTAYRDFHVMEANMRKRGELSSERILLSNALIKFAGREYLSAKRGAPGAIADLKELIRRGFMVEVCANKITAAYVHLGAMAVEENRFPEAQEHWDKALRWARNPIWRMTILTNKAAAYSKDNEYGRAEAILRLLLREEPTNPLNWKNVGLLLGRQGRNREALVYYERARALCKVEGGTGGALLHGQVWLRAAMIHGKLLEQDGDLLLFLRRARDLQPYCPGPYQQIMQTVQRMTGSKEELAKLRERAKKEEAEARKRYDSDAASDSLSRLCGGLWDYSDGGTIPLQPPRLDPDPLEGFGLDNVPEWLEKAARRRDPFRPYDPAIDSQAPKEKPGSDPAAGEALPAEERRGPSALLTIGAVIVVSGLALAFFSARRRKRSRAA
ncbi:MAG: tetratricopeptide repeat protein [Planctomycetota bacterium]